MAHGLRNMLGYDKHTSIPLNIYLVIRKEASNVEVHFIMFFMNVGDDMHVHG